MSQKIWQYRKEYQKNKSPFYHGTLHYFINIILALFFFILAAFQIQSYTLGIFFSIPIAILVFSLIEYISHRFFFHQIHPPFNFAYREHAGGHHLYFADDVVYIDHHKDNRRVIFPWYGIILYIIVGLPFNLIIGFALSKDIGFLFLAMQIAYFILYENIHLICHLRKNHPLLRFKMFRNIRRHHEIHHQSNKMNQCNFGIVSPLYDYLFFTKLK